MERGEGEQDNTCVVCLEEMEAGQRVRKLGCGHSFHDQCCVIWLVKVNCCPICRVPPVQDGEEGERGFMLDGIGAEVREDRGLR